MFIDSISNDKNYMRCGIGSQMMNYIVNLAKKEKCDAIKLQVNSKNISAINFYEHFDMTEKSRTMELNIKDML